MAGITAPTAGASPIDITIPPAAIGSSATRPM
jgi:hypothetical protein